VSVETVLALAASSFGVVMGVGPSLQIRRMLRERSSRDVSLGNLALVIPNSVGFLVTIVTILVALRLRRNEPDLTPVPDPEIVWQSAR